ncbi:MAG TPA: BMP family protein [Candidatus Izemoplasmatales bacterium]|nr:BMP family protein [Candidatus Izemoplasmatales bacterium]
MKKFLLVFAALFLTFGAVACGGANDDFQVGLVTDTGGIDDKSFNQGTWEGILRFAEDYDLPEDNRRYLQSSSDADYIPNISAFADEQLDLIVMPGFLFEDALKNASENYPEQNFLIIDSVVEADNVASAVFAEPEGSFLVGVAAALKAQDASEDTVGFIGGGDFPLIHGFEAGYVAGVHAVDPDMTVLVDYVGDFTSNDKGQALAVKQFDNGAYVIYHAAGGAGNGAISEAKSRRTNGEDVWVIGVDKDQYEEGIYNDDDDSAILTSMVKRVDVAAYEVAEDTLNDEFPGGQVLIFDLENNGVGLPDDNPNLSAEILSTVSDYRDDIIAGDITVPTVPERLNE